MTKYGLACFIETDMGQSAERYRRFLIVEAPSLEEARAEWRRQNPALTEKMAESSWHGSLVLLSCDDYMQGDYHRNDRVAVVDGKLVRTDRACHFPTVIE